MFAIPPLLIFSRHCKMNNGYSLPDVYTDTHRAFFFESAMRILIHTAPTIVYRLFCPLSADLFGNYKFRLSNSNHTTAGTKPRRWRGQGHRRPGGDGASIAQMYICAACRGNPLTPMPPAGGNFTAQAAERRKMCLRKETPITYTSN